jgi:sporulation protein YlmC with PRC-barrel domain
MERYYSQLIGSPIFSENGQAVGRIFELIMETETGKLVGFLLAPNGKKVIMAQDVSLWNRQLVISDLDDIFDTEEMVKIQEILKRKIPIIKNRVVSESGDYLGQVFDFALDTKFFTLTKIVVAKNFFGIFQYDEKIIAQKNIVEIKKTAIIVKNPIGLIPVQKHRTPKKVKRKLNIDVAPTIS